MIGKQLVAPLVAHFAMGGQGVATVVMSRRSLSSGLKRQHRAAVQRKKPDALFCHSLYMDLLCIIWTRKFSFVVVQRTLDKTSTYIREQADGYSSGMGLGRGIELLRLYFPFAAMASSSLE